MNWRRQANGNYQFNIYRIDQDDTIRVEFPLHATIRNLTEYVRHYTYPDIEMYQSSSCYIIVNGLEQNDTLTVDQLKYKKISASLNCPIYLTHDSLWKTEPDCLSFCVGLNDSSEIRFKMNPETKVNIMKRFICQQKGVNDLIVCANGIPVNMDSNIGSLVGQYLTGIGSY
jgi:hypothetical protein